MIGTGTLAAAGETAGDLLRLSTLSAAFDDMAASASRFDGSYELALDRFKALAGKRVSETE